MKRIKTLTAVAATALLYALPVQANLVTDGGFEDPAYGPAWGAFNATLSADTHSGVHAAQLNHSFATIVQSVAIVGGQAYTLDFWAKASGFGFLTIGLDGASAPNLNFGAGASDLSTTYKHFVYTLTPTAPGSLAFTWNDGTGFNAFIDDLKLTAVPEPTTFIAGALLLVPFGLSTLRKFRRVSTV